MRTPQCRAPWVAAVLCLLAVAAPGRAQVTLKYHFKPGDRRTYILENISRNTTEVMGKRYEARQAQKVRVLWEVQAVDETGRAKLRVRHTRVKLNVDSPDGKTEYDTDNLAGMKDADKTFAPMVRGLAKVDFTATVDPQGNVRDLTPAPAFLEEVKTLPPTIGASLASEEGLKRSLFQGGLVLPNKELRPGDTWRRTTDSKSPLGHLTGEVTFTYQGPEDRDGTALEKIALRPTLTVAPARDAPTKVTFKDGSGTAYFDRAAGRLVEGTMRQTLQMELQAGGRPVTTTVEQTTRFHLQPSPKE